MILQRPLWALWCQDGGAAIASNVVNAGAPKTGPWVPRGSGQVSKATALVSCARLPLPNRTISRKCAHALNMKNKVMATLKSMLQFHVLRYWLRTWLLPQNSALTGMFQERIPTISIQQPILLNPDPHSRVPMNTKGFQREGTNKKEKNIEINY